MADKYSSRNTKFNYYTDNDTIKSIDDYTAGKKDTNITLLDYNDYTKVTGSDIIVDAQKNPNAKWIKSTINTTGINSSDTYYIYGSPEKWVLDNHQQYYNCGVDSTLNSLVMAGYEKITNQNKTETDFTQKALDKNWCEDKGNFGYLDEPDGGTNCKSYESIFASYGIESTSYDYESETPTAGCDMETLANAISAGKCAVIGVCSGKLWGEKEPKIEIDHAICATGVVTNTEGVLQGFYIHDTGAWATRYITVADLAEATLYYTKIKIGAEEVDHQIYATLTNETVKSGTNNINATGNSLANIIAGNSGKNVIKGQGGNDTLYGMAGNDTIYGGSGNDLIYGNDSLSNEYGENVLYGDAGNDSIIGGKYSDTINGGTGNDTINGNNGNDIIHGDAGNDSINGGEGNDRLYGDAGNDSIEGGKGDDVINGGNGNDTIYGGEGHDSLGGGNGNDIIQGNDGDDEISGDDGNDTLYGNAGNDTIYGGKGNDYIEDSIGKNAIYGEAGNDYINTSEATEGQLIYGDDEKNKTQGNDTIIAGSGNDTINGGKGNDSIISGLGNDSITCYSGNNYINAGQGNDTIVCGNGKDTINGGEGNDLITCGGGNDTIIMSENWGCDTIESASGRNILQFEDINARKMNFNVLSDGNLFIQYDTNSVEYSKFYDETQEGYWPVYVQDEEYKYNVSCNMTETSGDEHLKIKVENSKGNNILLTKDNSTEITTSKYADIVYMDSEDDTITYTGGEDYYYSTTGDDEYIVKSVNKNTDLEINDGAGDDTIVIQTNKDNIKLFFDVTNDGETTANTDLTMFGNTDIQTLISNFANIKIDNYFTADKIIASESYTGAGRIENVYDSSFELNIDSAIKEISSAVASWLTGKSYTSACDVMENGELQDKMDLLAVYMDSCDINYLV